MYVVQDTLLGNTPAPAPAPSFLDSLLNVASSAATAGFNIYNRTQQIKQTQQQAGQAQALIQAYGMNPNAVLQPGMQTGIVPYSYSSGGSSWILPAAVGVGALALIFILKK